MLDKFYILYLQYILIFINMYFENFGWENKEKLFSKVFSIFFNPLVLLWGYILDKSFGNHIRGMHLSF